MASNPAVVSASKFMAEIDPVFEDLLARVKKKIRAGKSADVAVREAVRETRLERRLTEDILDKIAITIKRTTGEMPPVEVRRQWATTRWPDEDMTLSGKIHDLSRLEETKEIIRTSMRRDAGWRGTATKLRDSGNISGELPEYMTDLKQAARRSLGGDSAEYREYKKTVDRTAAQIERLSRAGAPNQRMKAAYQGIIDATEKKSEWGLEQAINSAVREKAGYNAERLARTEMAKAYIEGTYAKVRENKYVVGMGYDLSSRHRVKDVCDFHTKADLFGIGPGRYPLSHLPPYPFHPKCLCTAYEVFRGESGPLDNDAAIEFLEDMPERDRQALLGAEGAEKFKDNPGTWEDYLKGYQGHESINKLQKVKTI